MVSDFMYHLWLSFFQGNLLGPEIKQRLVKIDVPGCVNAAGKLGRSDKQQQ